MIANICATGHAEQILATQPCHCAIIDAASFVYPVLWDISSNDETKYDCQEIVSTLIEGGLLRTYSLKKEEHFHTYMLLNKCIRGELADLLTLATAHHASVALDDPVVKKRILPLLPEVPIQSTLTLLRHWYLTCHLSESTVQSACERIVNLAHFIPPNDDALRAWWDEIWPTQGNGSAKKRVGQTSRNI